MKGFKPAKGILSTSAQLAAGGVGAGLVKNLVKKVAPDSMQKFVPAAPLFLGILLSGNKKLQNVAFGLIAVGGKELVGQFIPSINGLEDMDLSGIFGMQMGGPLNGPLNFNVNEQYDGEMNGTNYSDY